MKQYVQRGAGLIEYALVLALVSVLTAATLAAMGTVIKRVFSDVIHNL